MHQATTPSQTIGPFFSILLPLGSNLLVAEDEPGAITLGGRIFDGAGEPVGDALVETWQAGRDGVYPHTADSRFRGSAAVIGYGRCLTDADGQFTLRTWKPGPVPGFDERMQAPHINVSVFARGLLRRLTTRIYFPDEERANAIDPALQSVAPERRQTLIARPEGPAGLRFDIRLQGERETVFFDV
jgi:protocatechuate 3,4-dioxygenase alpha subunit